MTTMTREKIAKIRVDMEAALVKIAEQHGIEKFSIGSIRFNEDNMRCEIKSNFVGGDTIEMRALKDNAHILGFDKKIAGSVIQYGSMKSDYTVIGLRRTKLILKSMVDNKDYVAKIDDVKSSLRLSGSPLVA